MKVIELTHRIMFVDDIVSIYDEYKCGEFANYYNYYIETKHGRISVNEHDYKKVKEYLLSLSVEKEDTPKEDKKIEKFKVIKDNSGDSVQLVYDGMKLDLTLLQAIILDKINEIIDKINTD